MDEVCLLSYQENRFQGLPELAQMRNPHLETGRDFCRK